MTIPICQSCDGSGLLNGVEGWKCFTCNGFGVLKDEDPDDADDDDDDDDDDQGLEYDRLEDQKRNDAMERGDEMRDRAKDERA